jgi:hypothetical protein
VEEEVRGWAYSMKRLALMELNAIARRSTPEFDVIVAWSNQD